MRLRPESNGASRSPHQIIRSPERLHDLHALNASRIALLRSSGFHCRLVDFLCGFLEHVDRRGRAHRPARSVFLARCAARGSSSTTARASSRNS